MPELPEVQTTVSGLSRVLPKQTIKDIWTDWPKMFHWSGGHLLSSSSIFLHFKKSLVGSKIVSVSRRGKNIIFILSNGKAFIVHMRMTGHLLYGKWQIGDGKWRPVDKKSPLNDPFNRFAHVVLSLSSGNKLVFSDTRKFGRFDLENAKNIEHSPQLSHLGPEPLEPSFTLKKFTARLATRPRGKVKPVLLDQRTVAGIGNIYSDEMLWRAGIHPESQVSKISPTKTRLLYLEMRKVLKSGISFGGDSMSDYRNIFGEKGKFQEKHNAYRRTGKTCGKKGCDGIIKRKMVGGRSSHFCPTHQKLFK